ncbi:sensor histidine kinase [Agromyces sp. MMS24-JH15]|uniref:sensor histidine kinase n=1 Tax=Agromyces sp. MMS24-JH15 TaxID=3243765 RepID=UPI003749CE95
MTRPGDPGHAAAARAAQAGAPAGPSRPAGPPSPGGSSRPGGPSRPGDAGTATDAPPAGRAPLSLRGRLLLVLGTLLVAVSAIVGVASVAVFHNAAVDRLDADLEQAVDRAGFALQRQPPGRDDTSDLPGVVLNIPGQEAGTLAAVTRASGDATALYIAEYGRVLQLPDEYTDVLAGVPADGEAHTVEVGELGPFRAQATTRPDWNGVTIVLALPLADVTAATAQLALTTSLVAIIGLALAIWVGWVVISRALAPLERVTAAAQRVSELPLERGDVDLDERVAVDDPRTEVGRLGTAFNRMLGHVGASLSAREQSERKVRRFVADASHELRTPLASIRGYAELTRLHGGKLPDDVVRAIGRIESESLRMTELVEDLLLLARLDEGRELERLPVDLRSLVADAVGDAQVAGPDHEWSVVADDPVSVTGDEPRLRQVLANLLANARVHTPAGTSVEVRLTRAPDAARIVVVDDGPGIDPEVRDSLFERFVRGDSSRSRRAGSTGLGLAIVQAVVDAHGGEVVVESEPGRTAFTVELPLDSRPVVE